MIRSLLCFAILAILPWSGAHAAAPVDYSATEKAQDFGHLKQADLAPITPCGNGLDKSGCGPSAATNSFLFLENTYPNVYGGKLVLNPAKKDLDNNGKVDSYDSLIATAADLAQNFMCTCANNTTTRTDFYTGKQKYIDGKVPDSTTYEVMDDPALDTLDAGGKGLKFPDGTPGLARQAPTPQFLSANLKTGEDVEILLTRDDGTTLNFGHYVTVTELKWVDQDGDNKVSAGDGKVTISFVDPAQPAGQEEQTRDLVQDPATGVLSIIRPSDGVKTQIRMAVKESPKPPASSSTGASTAGTSSKSLIYNAADGTLTLTPFELTSAYMAAFAGSLDPNLIDPLFANDPILGATVTVSPFHFGQSLGSATSFNGFDNILTIAKGGQTLLTAFASTLIYDPDLAVPFYAPLSILSVDTSQGSAFLDEMALRLGQGNSLPFDLFINPGTDFAGATNQFSTSADIPVVAGIAQDIELPEPGTLSMFGALSLIVLAAAGSRRRRHQK